LSGPGVQTVLVPLDGSDRAEAALRPAVELAERMDADLVLMTTRWNATAVKTVERYLDVHIALLERDARPLVVLDRDAPDAIVFAAREPGTLVCMTTHGRGGVMSVMLGSVAEAVVREAHGPVVLMGPSMRPDWVLPASPTILAGFDGSAPGYAGVRAAGDVAAALGARVRVIEIARLPNILHTTRLAAGHVDALEDAVAELGATGVEAQYEVLDGVDEADGLIAEAARTDAALLALGTHGRRGVARVALGSVAARVVRHATVPVLVACPTDAAEHGPASEIDRES
jgi:nucleotide-binding universal stress UspA family protein